MRLLLARDVEAVMRELVAACGGAASATFGAEGVRRALAGAHASAAAAVESVFSAVKAFAGDGPAIDDCTVVAVRRG